MGLDLVGQYNASTDEEIPLDLEYYTEKLPALIARQLVSK